MRRRFAITSQRERAQCTYWVDTVEHLWTEMNLWAWVYNDDDDDDGADGGGGGGGIQS